MASFRELLRAAKAEIDEVDIVGGAQLLDGGHLLLDVRERDEVEICSLPGITHIPLGELSVRHTELDPDAETVCICHHGVRSAHAAAALAQLEAAAGAES